MDIFTFVAVVVFLLATVAVIIWFGKSDERSSK